MEKLLRGFDEFRRSALPGLAGTFRRLATTQKPHVLFFACSDSRVVPNLLTAADPGDMFEVRTVGNLVAPADPAGNGAARGDVSEASAVEYAVEILGVPNIVVCGHSTCGAMQAVLQRSEDRKTPSITPNLDQWLQHARPSIARLLLSPSIDKSLPEVDRLSQANVLQQMQHVLTYPCVQRKVIAGQVQTAAIWFDVASASIYIFDPELQRFMLLDDAEIQRLLALNRG